MLIYHHTKEQLASAVARNLSKNTNDFVYAYVGSTKSVPSMKYVDTTVIRVASHCELPASGVNLIFAVYWKGKKKPANFLQDYKSGKEKTEYAIMCFGGEIAENSLKNGYYLKWLDSVPCISSTGDLPIKELDYTEAIAEFFVNMIKSICKLNEKIKDFLEPEMIIKIAGNRTKFLE